MRGFARMRANGRSGMIAAAVCLLVLLAGCSTADGPVSLTSAKGASVPQPAGVVAGKDALQGVHGEDTSCGDPTASLKPRRSAGHGKTVQDIRSRGTLRVGVDNNTYLFGFRDPNTGQLEGFDIDIVRAMAKAILGDPSKAEFKEITSAQRVTALRRGDVDMVIRTMSITCSRLSQVSFSATYFVANQRVLVQGDSRARSLDDLGGKKICATAGSTSLQLIASSPSHPIPVAVPNWSDCLVMLQQHQVAGVSTDDTILAGMQAQDPNTKIIGPSLAAEYYGIAMRKGADDLVRFVNGALQRYKHSGSWRASYSRWIGSRLGPVPAPPAPKYR